jgi:hypothetical protein
MAEEKFSQGNLFPKGSEGNPYSKNPRAQSAKRKRDFKKQQEAKKKADDNFEESRQREWKAKKERGEVFGDMPPDFNLNFDDSAFKNRDILKILQQAASIRPYQQVGGSLFKALTIQQLGGYR